MGQTSKVVINNKLVTKTIIQEREYADRVFANEIFWLKRFTGKIGFPTYRGHSNGVIYINYCGNQLNRTNCPEDWQAQCGNILATLKFNNCRHHDIKPEEILVLDGKITLIDFGWAGPLDEETPIDYMHFGVGGHYRPKSPKGTYYYDDKLQMNNSLMEVIGKRV